MVNFAILAILKNGNQNAKIEKNLQKKYKKQVFFAKNFPFFDKIKQTSIKIATKKIQKFKKIPQFFLKKIPIF